MKRIAIIGAGPYGLIVLDRLIKQAPKEEKVELLLFDPDGPGGNIWRKNQSDQVIMNTVMQHVTLFSEDEGPNLAEWNKTEAPEYLSSFDQEDSFSAERALGKNDYCQRRYYGVYQSWFFDQQQKHLPENVTVTLIKERVVDLTEEETGISLTADRVYHVSDVVLATGHSANSLNEEEAENKTYAQAHGLFYQEPGNPSDTPLEELPTSDCVILRGLGLSFFDYIALFVAKWGGRFIEEETGLNYEPTGKEQQLIVGSGRGLPYHARPDNQKEPGEDAQPQLLTQPFMEDFDGGVEALVDLLRKEAELAYYEIKLVDTAIDETTFLREYRKGDREAVLTKYQIPDALRLDWSSLFDPAKEVSATEFPAFIQTYLKKDIEEAELGNETGAIAKAIDTYKEVQEPFNDMLDQERFSPKDYYEEFFGRFNRNYSFLTIGAPLIRQKQLLALVEAGVVTFLAPEMVVERKNKKFITYSKKDPERTFVGSSLIEARLPATSFTRTKNPLLIQMREKGYSAPHQISFDGKDHPTGAIKVQRQTHQLITQSGRIMSCIYCYGIPLEGLDWLNATSPRPKSDDRIFKLANRITRSIYK